MDIRIRQTPTGLVVDPAHVSVSGGQTLRFSSEVPVSIGFPQPILERSARNDSNRIAVDGSPVEVRLVSDLFSDRNAYVFQAEPTRESRGASFSQSTAQGELHPPGGGPVG